MSLREYDSIPRNRTCHNLLTTLPLPTGTKALLGNGLNFCLRNKLPTNKLSSTLDRFANDVRRTHFCCDRPLPEDADSTYNPKLYIKSTYLFKKASPDIEKCLANLTAALNTAQARYKKGRPPNLTPRQYSLLVFFKNSDLYIVIEANKNLGPCIMERETYIRRVIEEHLGDSAT